MPKQIKDIKQLQDAPNLQNYGNNPIQNYGMNLLKGMGFTQQRGIGFNKQNALNQPLILKPRPKGLGLGAKPQNQLIKVQQFNKKDFIKIISQTHKGMIGIVKKVKLEQKILTIELGISGTELKVKFQQVQKITQQQFNTKRKNIIDQQKNQQGEQKKKKRLKWIIPSIKCKIISKTSIYYLKKVLVTQLINEREFQCLHISQNGMKKFIRDLRQKDLQTVLPKEGEVVLVLDKKFRGKKAKILQRNKQKGEVIVQLLETLQIQKIDENYVAEFVDI